MYALMYETVCAQMKTEFAAFANVLYLFACSAAAFARNVAYDWLRPARFVAGPEYSELTYWHGEKEYCVRYAPRPRGPCRYSAVLGSAPNGVTRDVTERVERFAGPDKSFHGIPTTPEMLGYTELTLVLRASFHAQGASADNHTLTFGAKDPIVL